MSDTVVETTYGKVRGSDTGPVSVWKGIPYAQPPVGNLRFRPPQPHEAWTNVREAIKFAPSAPQDIPHLGGLTEALSASPETPGALSDDPIGSEDCLYLNIWSPRADNKKRPVMVWIHGGAFVVGSGSQPDYNGTSFATQGDVVVVTLNYRLGVLGFLHLAELAEEPYTSAGNCGLLDQIAALQWVQKNIAAFGGDPHNVTIFGESAGAMSIGALLVMPASRGLFKRAILESGAAHSIQTGEEGAQVARDLFALLGIKQVAELVEIPLETLLAAQTKLLEQKPLGGIRPVVDGRDIPEEAIQAITSGIAKDVALLIGTNHDEMNLFLASATDSPPDPEVAQKILGERTIEVFSTYAMQRPGVDMREIGSAMFTDHTFRIPAIRLAEHQARHAQVWMYRFDWSSPNKQFASCHALEMPFVWNIFDKSTFRALLGTNPPSELAQRMHSSWIAFAHTGDPNILDLPAWPVYDPERRATLLFNEQCEVVDDPQGVERAVWEGIL